MDEPVDDLDELDANLRDIAFANAHLGGTALAIADDATRRGAHVRLTCVDHSEQMLALARRRCGDRTNLTFVRADGTALPFERGAFDVALCTLALHHFDREPAIALLRELRRVSRMTPVVCDLRRSAIAFAATWLWSRTSRNRLTRHDAPLSVRRAYTPDEAIALAREAGWRAPTVRREPFFRMLLADAS
ncbi:MAG: methyltransferase domain-containing protein [Vulcanimicrobiaceae bacterium]